jgi:hypothetical protein
VHELLQYFPVGENNALRRAELNIGALPRCANKRVADVMVDLGPDRERSAIDEHVFVSVIAYKEIYLGRRRLMRAVVDDVDAVGNVSVYVGVAALNCDAKCGNEPCRSGGRYGRGGSDKPN